MKCITYKYWAKISNAIFSFKLTQKILRDLKYLFTSIFLRAKRDAFYKLNCSSEVKVLLCAFVDLSTSFLLYKSFIFGNFSNGVTFQSKNSCLIFFQKIFPIWNPFFLFLWDKVCIKPHARSKHCDTTQNDLQIAVGLLASFNFLSKKKQFTTTSYSKYKYSLTSVAYTICWIVLR